MSALDIEKSREEFEAAARSIGLCMTRTATELMFANGRRVPVGGYILPAAEAAWAMWQASRAALVVALPKPFMRYNENGNMPWTDMYSGDQVRAAIEAVGVRWR